MAGFLKNRRPFLSGYYLVDNLKGNYEIPSYKKRDCNYSLKDRLP